ncbi:TonB-dependent receptor domain-containing protein [Arcobacter sp. YIC-464]|uniref:TonB-dependent receptor plug domain-containing protein n=1 Tax=Arcobacter sp. YIC-464 TaxID=3376631 RepID=UPI003C1C5D1E
MKKITTISFLCAASLLGANDTIELEKIEVQEKINSKIVKDVSNEQIKSADLAESLYKNVPSISLVRRSGIANDIILRGQKKDNINILIDDAKIYGACPNRMDPPTSHVLSNNIESVEVIEGPYDVENFGTLSGKVKVNTKEPAKDFKGEINAGFGSFGYQKLSANVSGGNDKVKVLISASTEKSDQYEDGNGNDFLEQQKANGIPFDNQYSKSDLEAYEKKTLLTKLIFNIDDSSEIKLSYNANRSDNVLYPNTPMDANYDDSNIYTLGYTKRDLGEYSKELSLDYYYSNVDHPMSTIYRNNGAMQMTNHMKSSIWGAKIKNSMDINDSLITFGLDTSTRNWRGKYLNKNNPYIGDSIASTDTINKALFFKAQRTYGKVDLEVGSRYDYTEVETLDLAKQDNKYTSINANIFATYNADENTKYFAGLGKASRVPDARELYSKTSIGTYTGNDDLEQTKNYELDLGFEKTIGAFNIRTKAFYSKLEDYIYNTGTFTNIDAKIYGLDISGFYYLTDEVSFDYGIAYQRGKKDGDYTDKDLAEIAPLKGNFAINYEKGDAKFTTEIIAVDSWDSFDSDNGEQELGGYAVVNTKYSNKINKNIGFTLGVDNIFDKTYTSTNTYNDIRYIGVGQTELLNDPGRYFYANLKYSF